ncbi:MAG: hypothetical protein KJ000_17810 [Pirellulaceae bacterium]|nr:hypothetical protein [Pirellulaceae bacterium]
MSRPRSKSSSGDRRTWRRGPARTPEAKSRIRPLRWMFTGLVLVLIVAFAVIVFPILRRQRHLVAIAIWATDQLAVEPLPYAREDVDGLSSVPDVQFLGSLGLQDQASFGSLGNQLRDVVGGRDDLLALYLAAHGVTEGDQAFVVCSDFLRTPEGGRFPVRDLFGQLAESPAKLKLLILDAGRLGYEPRLGIVANEFPRLVEQELAAMPEQELWVLLSAAPLQRTAAAHPRRQSLFGYSVADALRGAADREPQDRYVTLFETYVHVDNECTRWFGADSPARHTPLLMKAGRGVVSPSRDGQGDDAHRLVWVGKPTGGADDKSTEKPNEPPDKPPAAESNDGTPSADAVAASPKSETATAAGAEKDSPDATVEKNQAEPTTAAPGTTGEGGEGGKAGAGGATDGSRRLLALLNEAWLLRDELQVSAAEPRRSPVHFAPHVWRELNALLLSYEQRARAGRPFQPLDSLPGSPDVGMDRLLGGLESLCEDLRALRRRWQGQAADVLDLRNDVARRLDRLWQQAGASTADSSAAGPALPEVVRVRDAAYGTNRMVFQAVDYVRWHAVASMTAYETSPLFGDLCKYLESLGRYQQRLDDLRQYPLESDNLASLTGVRQQFEDLVAMRDRLDQMLQARTADSLSKLASSGSQLQIENDLQTPLLPAARRNELLQRLLEAPAPAAALTGIADARIAADRRRCQRVLERLTVESLLIRLADADAAKELEIRLGPLRDVLSGSAWDENSFWLECRKLGSFLQTFYKNLPQRSEYRVLHLVDPRDAVRVAAAPPGFAFDLEVRIRPQLRLSGPQQQPLRSSQPQTVTVELSGNQRELIARPPSLQFDRRLLDVVGGPQEGSVQAESGWFRKSVSWQVVAKMNQEQANAVETLLSLSVQWNDGSGPQQITHDVLMTLPQPNRVDLEVRRAGASVPRTDDATGLQLDLFPNRSTAFQFTLVNRSGVERNVDVSLYAVSQRYAGRTAPGNLDNTLRRAVLDSITGTVDADLIARTAAPVALPADPERRTPINLAHPAAAAAPAPKPEPDAPPVAPTLPPAFEGADISLGMLCVIRDVQSPDVVWYKWIGWKVIEPRRFLDAEVGYDYQRLGVRVRLRGKDFDGDGQADLPRGTPVEVRWLDTLGQIPAGATKQLQGKLDASKEFVELFAAIPADDQKRLVTLAVDGYPRGLVYEVPCLQQPPVGSGLRLGSDIRRTDRRIRINRLVAPGFPYEFHFSPYVDWPLQPPPPAADGGAAPPTPVRVMPGEFVFVPAPCRELRVDFETDAPVDAFRDPDHRIEVRVGDSLSPALAFFDDRSATARLATVGDRGLLQFETTVSDYSVSLDPGAIENVRTFLRLQLRLPGIGEAEDRARIALDSEPPLVQQVQVLSARTGALLPKRQGAFQAPRQQPLIARVEVQDLSGIQVAEYELVDPASGRKTLQTPKTHRPQPSGSSDEQHVFDLPLDTKELTLDRYRLLLRIRDLAGHDSQLATADIEFAAAAPAAVKGVIKGVLRFGANQNPVRGTTFKVTLESPDRSVRNVPVASDGSFTVPDLMPGAYNLAAQGTVMNRVVVGKLEGVQPSPPSEARPVTLAVDYQR